MAYGRNNQRSNPFDDEDDDDFERVEVNSLRSKHELCQDRIFESTARSLALIDDSHDMAIKTAEELHGQGEQLNRIEKNLDQIHNDMNTADRHMRSIKSVWGAMANYFKKPVKPGSTASREGSENSNSNKQANDLLEDPNSMNFQAQSDSNRYSNQRRQAQSQRQERNDFDGRLDSQLDQISRGLGRLKEDSLVLGTEIDRQNVQIERIYGKTDTAEARIDKTDKEIKKILRR